MKKLLVLTIAMLLVGVGIAGASTLKMSGEYYVRGQWVDNHDGTNIVDENDSHGFYDHEMSLNINWIMTPYTKVIARLELRDETWATSGTPAEGNATTTNQENIYVERLWAQHTFMNHTTIRVGLMQTASWASDFGNDSTEAYRLMVLQPTKIGTLGLYTEKDQANSIVVAEKLEADDDNDAYVAFLISKVGGVNLLPLIKYVDVEGPAIHGLDFTAIAFDLGANGTMNNIGWEAELVYVDYNYDVSTSDYSMWGAYANVWAQLNAVKVGGFVAYGSYDEDVDKGFSFGDDFDTGNTLKAERPMLLGDEVLSYSSSSLGHNDLESGTLLALYATLAINEKASVSAFAGYFDSNVEVAATDATAVLSQIRFDGASAWEVNVTGEYKITPLLTYAVGLATAQLEYGDGSTDPDAAIELAHRLSFKF